MDLETVILVSLYVILISLGLFALIIALNTNVYGKNKMVNDISGAWTKNRISPSIRAETDASRRSEHKESASFILSMLGALAINYVFLYILQF